MEIYFGVVEDRNDPLKLGRCRVRVAGLHTENKLELPTDDLPWATPIQPITSAGSSGIGISPTGIVTGSWVVLTFLDEFNQSPLILGTVAGIPNNSGFVSDTSDNTSTDLGGLSTIETMPSEIPNSEVEEEKPYLGTLSKSQYDSVIDKFFKIGGKSNNFTDDVSFGTARVSAIMIDKYGFIKSGDSALKDFSKFTWTNKAGIKTTEDAYQSTQYRKIIDTILQGIYLELRGVGIIDTNISPEKLAGILGVTFYSDFKRTLTFLNKDTITSEIGLSGEEIFNECYQAIKGIPTYEIPSRENLNAKPIDENVAGSFDSSKYDVNSAELPAAVQNTEGFKDPAGIYPKYENFSDIPLLSRHQQIADSIIPEKEASHVKSVKIANSSTTWSQPKVPYNADYPYNHVYTSESGHVMEFDDTPDCERVNIHHRKGTFIEMDPNGSQVNRIVGHGCTIIEKDGIIKISGNGHVHLEGNLTVYAGSDIQLECANVNVKTGKYNIECDEYNVKAGKYKVSADASVTGTMDISGLTKVGTLNVTTAALVKGVMAIDGAFALNTGGASGAQPPQPEAAASISNFSGGFDDLYIKTRSERIDLALENTDDGNRNSVLNSVGATPKTEQKKDESEPEKPAEPVITTCDLIKPYGSNTILSTNFKLKDLLKDGDFAYGGQRGLSADEIMCNLKALCINVIEPLFGRYKADGIKINSCFRKGDGTSQHEIGEAVDIGFAKHRGKPNDREIYFNIANEIKQLIPYDQILMEYTDEGHVWIHISFSKKRLRRNIMTFNNHKKHSDGMVLLA